SPNMPMGEHLERQGARLFTWLPEKQTAPPQGDYDGLIVLGGPMNAHEDERFPHLRQTVELIQQFYLKNKPIMGICLGAQLIARAFGSQVYRHTVPELGFLSVRTLSTLTKNPETDVVIDVEIEQSTELWLQNCPFNIKLMQWHFDTFELPEQATLLLTNDVCQNQAFRIGNNVYGFQFHLEVTPEIVMSWLKMKNAWIEANYPQLDQQLREQVQRYSAQSAQFAEQVAKDWLTRLSTKTLAPSP
ncbi:MAG: gamma-glutamyl-gamma-aminobutyrate hydrolase family protein, partial [Cyanobacteria bacterium J06555_13]